MNIIFVIPIILFMCLLGFFIFPNLGGTQDTKFTIPTSSTRTDHVDRQPLDGCYPALAQNGTYYEVCPEHGK